MPHKHTNQLILETSPYLLQHAHNPVDWHPWNDETLEKARALDKMMLISIGYSSCHWCHVMERESFEDDEIAKLMNDNFICIKVDREERPDVDQVYMSAVQLITGSGGWPLNVFTLPDGKPFFGGTYFRKEQWRDLLGNISLLYETRREDLGAQANDLTEGVLRTDLVHIDQPDGPVSFEDIEAMAANLSQRFDKENGGSRGAPKFPMPNNYLFLLRYHFHTQRQEILDHIKLTLQKMAFGGIYDQIGGGFARYSVDNEWRVPHFEKMLYDNAQLVTLYSEAYRATGDPLFKQTVKETLKFINREMTHPDGGFYSALDADSEGVEGKFYTWSEEELDQLLAGRSLSVRKFYNAGGAGLWEDNRNILMRSHTYEEFARNLGISRSAFKKTLSESKKILMKERKKRTRPGLDDKILASWNALMLKAYLRAYHALGTPKFLERALENYRFMVLNLEKPDGSLFHSWKDGKAAINGFLEDYCFYIDALIELYGVTFDTAYLEKAHRLTEYTIEHFYSTENGLFHFTSSLDGGLIVRKTEIHDNVIPSGNSTMAGLLFKLGHILDIPGYIEKSEKMLGRVKKDMVRYPSAYSNWGILGISLSRPHYNVAVSGKGAQGIAELLNKTFLPNIFLVASEKPTELPLLEGRFSGLKTLIYVCSGKSCELPVESVDEALNLIKR